MYRFPANKSATWDGVMPAQVASTGLAGSPRSKRIGPLTPGAPWWMCITVASLTLCVQTSENQLLAESNWPMQPPRSVVGTGGTSCAPDKSKTKIDGDVNVRRLWNVHVTASPACSDTVTVRENGLPVLS